MMATRGPWLTTYTGRKFYILDPRPDEVNPADIVHALARIGRFGGHASPFYSVAQHSSIAHDLAKESTRDPLAPKVALLHDAAEAYIGDVIHPLKVLLKEIKAIETGILGAIFSRFGIERVDIVTWSRVKTIDRRLLFSEAAALLATPAHVQEWAGYDPAELLPPGTVEPWGGSFERGEYEFGKRLEATFGAVL